MAKIIDDIVNVSINDAISSVSTIDVNKVAIIGAGSGTAKLCYSSADAESFGEDSQLLGMAKAFFGQDNQPSEFVAVPLTINAQTTAAAITGALETAAGVGEFYHICLAGEIDEDILADLQAWANENKKIFEIQADTEAATLQAKLGAISANRIAIFKHGVAGEYLNVALVAKRCGLDSARGTFAHKTVKGITADQYTESEYKTAKNAGLNIYTKVQGEARVFMGTTCDAEHFIDQVVVDDWLRFNVQSEIYKLLGEANDGAGVTYNDPGIIAVVSCVTKIFGQAAEPGRDYIRDDFSVDYKNLDYLKANRAADVRARNLPLISGTYSRMGAIHSAKVTLNVTL